MRLKLPALVLGAYFAGMVLRESPLNHRVEQEAQLLRRENVGMVRMESRNWRGIWRGMFLSN